MSRSHLPSIALLLTCLISLTSISCSSSNPRAPDAGARDTGTSDTGLGDAGDAETSDGGGPDTPDGGGDGFCSGTQVWQNTIEFAEPAPQLPWAVASNVFGRGAIAWSAQDPVGSDHALFLRRISAAGLAVSIEIGAFALPKIAVTASDQTYIVAFDNNSADRGATLLQIGADNSATEVTTVASVTTFEIAAEGDQAIAGFSSVDGVFVMRYEGDDWQRTQLLEAGEPNRSIRITIADDGTAFFVSGDASEDGYAWSAGPGAVWTELPRIAPQAAWAPGIDVNADRLAIAWNQGTDVYARFYDRGMNEWGEETLLGEGFRPSLVLHSEGGVVMWDRTPADAEIAFSRCEGACETWSAPQSAGPGVFASVAADPSGGQLFSIFQNGMNMVGRRFTPAAALGPRLDFETGSGSSQFGRVTRCGHAVWSTYNNEEMRYHVYFSTGLEP